MYGGSKRLRFDYLPLGFEKHMNDIYQNFDVLSGVENKQYDQYGMVSRIPLTWKIGVQLQNYN